MPSPICRRILASGRVQGVGYRLTCAEVASRLGVDGYVQNLPDGSVEVVACGPPEQVERLVEWCRIGPRSARVDRLTVTDQLAGRPAPAKGFHVA